MAEPFFSTSGAVISHDQTLINAQGLINFSIGARVMTQLCGLQSVEPGHVATRKTKVRTCIDKSLLGLRPGCLVNSYS